MHQRQTRFCSNCGTEIDSEAEFCPNCGTRQSAGFPTSKKERPTGVTVLAALEIISGIILSLVGSALFIVGTLVLAFFGELDLLPLTLTLIGGILPILGVLSFVVAYGYLKGKGWAWTLGLIHSIIEILLGIASLPTGETAALTGLIYVALDGLIIYYLTRPYVKQFFGKA